MGVSSNVDSVNGTGEADDRVSVRMTESKKNAHSKCSIVLTDCEEVSFASVFSDMFADSSSIQTASDSVESAPQVDHRGATSVEFIFGEIRMPMHSNSGEVTKLHGHISALIWRSSLLASSIICGYTFIPVLDTQCIDVSGNRTMFTSIFGRSDRHRHWLQGCDVLELGCGRGLVGKVCKKLGAKSVVLTDCDDRALQRLRSEFRGDSTESAPKFSCDLFHLLWERERCDAEHASLAAVSGTDSYEATPLTIRHWADAYRLPDEFPYLDPSSRFDFVIASDCLYFHVQEEPLASTIHRRLKHPDGIGMILVETRGNGAFQLERFLQLLRSKGFASVIFDSGPWDFDLLVRCHVQKDALTVDSPCIATTGHEQNGPHVILVSWL